LEGLLQSFACCSEFAAITRVMRLPGWALDFTDHDHPPFAILALELIIAVGDGSSDAPSTRDLAETLSARSCSPPTVSPLVPTISTKLPYPKSVVDSADNGNKAERSHIRSLAGGKQIDEISEVTGACKRSSFCPQDKQARTVQEVAPASQPRCQGDTR
jgi:hypothetical protein